MITYQEVHEIIHLFNSKLFDGQRLSFIPDYLIKMVYEDITTKQKPISKKYVSQYRITYSDGHQLTVNFNTNRIDPKYWDQFTDAGIPIELATQVIDEWNKLVSHNQRDTSMDYNYSLVLEEEK